ncbi:MAG: hypothetical protein IIZ19_09900 [Clostridia bacterium]|nr:hypothetical protein [Clostridia bacterium]
MLDYESDHYCPAYKRVIDIDLCYDSLMGLSKSVKISSVKELSGIKDIEEARRVCAECPYSDLGAGMDDWEIAPDLL